VPSLDTTFARQVGIEVPLICGAMYPCSNPELIAAVSAAGGIGIIQPISMTFVHKRDLREGIRWIRSQTDKPIGFNAIVEKSSKVYEDRMRKWIDIALEEGVRFFVTALGDPRWVVEKVHAVGGIVYHDVTERKWAEKALAGGVDGLICVNRDAGGHAGTASAEQLWRDLGDLGVPLVAAGGVGDAAAFARTLDIGFSGVQLGTRFIATTECRAHDDYKQAILRARPEDIVLTERISGVPVAVIKTPYIEKVGTQASFLMKRALQHAKLKHYARLYYTVKSVFELRRASLQGVSYRDFFQAGKSVVGIDAIEPAGDIVRRFAAAVQVPAAATA
jgi:nitronate monooxygenase